MNRKGAHTMAIGERIHFFRILRGMTQKYLGISLGFDEKSADVRIAQYETGTRSPKDNYINSLADTLGVAPQALTIPNIENFEGLMHTLFALEDIYGFKINCIDGELCVSLKKFDNPSYPELYDHFEAWWEQAARLRDGKISKDQYDEWRYHYTSSKSSGNTTKIPSSDLMNRITANLDK